MDDSGQLGEHIRGSEPGDSVKDTNPKDALGTAKVPFHCVSAKVMLELGLAMMEGGRKYGTHNYRKMGVRASVYYNAAMRHMMDFWEGQDIDPDSGVHHIVKAIACMAILRDSQLMGNWEDDRPIRLPDGLNIAEMNEQAAEIIKKYPVCKMPFIHAGPKMQMSKGEEAEERKRAQEKADNPMLVIGMDIGVGDECVFSLLGVDCRCGKCRAEKEIKAFKNAKSGNRCPNAFKVRRDVCNCVSCKGIRRIEQKENLGRVGEPWSNIEEIYLRYMVKCNRPVEEIAKLHKRTNGAIRSRMEFMGLEFESEVQHEEGKVTYDNAVDGECYDTDRLCRCDTCRAGWNKDLLP